MTPALKVYSLVSDTDELRRADLMAKLRNVYRYLCVWEYTAAYAPPVHRPAVCLLIKRLRRLGEFFEMQNGKPMSEEQIKYTENLFARIWRLFSVAETGEA